MMTPAPHTEWPASYVSLSNCDEVGVDNLPALVRHAADELDHRSIEPDQILDITVGQEFTDRTEWSPTIDWAQPDRAGLAQ